MGKQNKSAVAPAGKDSAVNLMFVGVICLAVGLGIGYYFGKTAGSSDLPAVTAGQPPSSQAPIMDPATFLQNEASFKSIINSNPRDVNALIQLGNLYYDNNKYSDAVQWYGKALEIDPNNISVRTDRGTCYWSMGQADAAIAEFQKSLLVNPTHPQTLFNLGIVYLHGKNDMGEARKAWEKLLAANPDYPDRARLQQMLASLGAPAAGPATTTTTASPAEQKKPGTSNMDDLFNRMKK